MQCKLRKTIQFVVNYLLNNLWKTFRMSNHKVNVQNGFIRSFWYFKGGNSGTDFNASFLRIKWSDKIFKLNKFRNCDCNVTNTFIPTPETKEIRQAEND